jgi:hypothetical protein
VRERRSEREKGKVREGNSRLEGDVWHVCGGAVTPRVTYAHRRHHKGARRGRRSANKSVSEREPRESIYIHTYTCIYIERKIARTHTTKERGENEV